MKRPFKIAITGGSGFVGQHLLAGLSSSSHFFRIITRDLSKKINNIPLNSEIVNADLTNYDSLKKAFEGIDIIVNIAAEVRDQKQLAETNISGTKNLIKAALENKVSKIIHLSSVGVVGMQYSGSACIVNEGTGCDPKNEYERTKLESEKLLLEARNQNNFLLTILRPTNVFGEHHPYNALLHLINHINSGKITLCSKSSMVNYVYVKDLTNLIRLLIDDEKEYGIINVGDSQELPSILKCIAVDLGKKANILILPQFLFNFSEMVGIKKLRSISNHVIYNDGKLKAFFYYPYGFQNGLKNTIEYYKFQNLIK
ncbi:MAG: NAD(P)-dependent oxidoreductase [Bacteroidetes bacterium]|nr:NAD(P)-dependent oxidoreductase [Bacteroidota bacterium]